jgi:hypothetical protein
MGKRMRPVATISTLLAAVAIVIAADPEPGLKVGAAVPGPFEPLHLTGPDAGDEACLYCKFGNAPVAMVFARRTSPALAELATRIEKAAVENRNAKLGTCIVFLDTSETLMTAARKLSDDTKLRETVVAVVEPGKVKTYDIAADADVTVVLYSRRTIRAVHQFRDGQLNTKAGDGVMASLRKMLAEK